MSTILTVLIIWTAVSFYLAPKVGRFLKRARLEQTNHLPPLPHGSILGKPEKQAV